MKEKTVQLRAHHLEWLGITQGKPLLSGKIGSYLTNPKGAVYKFLKKIQKNRDYKIELVEGPDFICRGCSNYDSSTNRCGTWYPDEHRESFRHPEEARLAADKFIKRRHDMSRFRKVGDLLDYKDWYGKVKS